MTPELWVALFIGIAPSVAAIIIAIDSRRSASRALKVSTQNSTALATVGQKVDGMMTRLEDRVSIAQAETVVSRQETADARVAGVEGVAAAVAGAQQERDRS